MTEKVLSSVLLIVSMSPGMIASKFAIIPENRAAWKHLTHWIVLCTGNVHKSCFFIYFTLYCGLYSISIEGIEMKPSVLTCAF